MNVSMQQTRLKPSLKESENDLLTQTNRIKNFLPIVIADIYCREILQAIMITPKSATEINAETHIPISTVYRKIQTMCDNDVLATSGSISEDGKKFFLYKSAIKEISIKFDGKLRVEVIRNRLE